uniref:non-specific serine/threonine protein kinase n=1 Tax=Aceria tosichella TaxID=561515 RepID=A0A6G1S7I7_9ACAR
MMPHTLSVLGNDHTTTTSNTTTMGTGQYGNIVIAWLPNQQHTKVSIKPGMTIRDALTKSLTLRKLEPDMCTVYIKRSPDGQTKQRIDWDVEVSMLKGDEIIVENKDKVPMHTQLSHTFARSYFTLSKCHFCQEFLMTSIRCLICGIEFHRNCANSVPKLCEPAIEHSNYYRHLLARSSGFSPTNALSTSESPTNTTWPIRPRARSADENSKHKTKSSHNNHHNNHVGNEQSTAPSQNHNIYVTNHSANSGEYVSGTINNPTTNTITTSAPANQVPRNHFLEEKWEIDGKEIIREQRIGQGSFATVYKGNWHGPVALKELNVKKPTPKQLQDFKNEVAVLKKTRHTNILLFIGYVLQPELIIVTQWCKGRSLYKHLHVEDIRTFTNCEIKDIALGIAQGMEYLHAKHIIHRDLKSNNIFIHDEDNLTVKIGDFGLATFKTRGEGGQQIYHPTGSILWMAPEVIKTKPGVNPFTFESDVYSYGIVLYELLSRKLPYFDFKHKDALLYLIGSGSPKLRLNLDVITPDKPEGLKVLMSKCIERDREKRPQFTSIIKDLKSIRLSRIPKSTSEPLRLNNLDFSANQSNDLMDTMMKLSIHNNNQI